MSKRSGMVLLAVVFALALGGPAVARAALGWMFSWHQDLTSVASAASNDVALGDLDDDGDLDAFVATDVGQPDRVWINQGSPTWYFVEGEGLGDFASRAVALGDLDGDNDLDAFLAQYNQGNRVYFNDGDGTLTDSLQELGSYPSLDVALGDLDGDGDLDAFVANDYPYADTVWLNDGAGNFAAPPRELGGAPSSGVALGDLDGDNDLDAFIAVNGEGNQVWLNDGAANFTDSGQSLFAATGQSYDVALGDLDGDGDLDAVTADDGANELWFNAGGVFSPGTPLGDAQSSAVALGDLDGDGDLDMVVANDAGQFNRIWLNLGSGGFSDGDNVTAGTGFSTAVALGRLDGTTSLDVFVANYDQPSQVWVKTTPTNVAMRQPGITAGPAWWVPLAGALLVVTLFSWGWQRRRR